MLARLLLDVALGVFRTHLAPVMPVVARLKTARVAVRLAMMVVAMVNTSVVNLLPVSVVVRVAMPHRTLRLVRLSRSTVLPN